MDFVDKENQPPDASLPALLAQLPLPGVTFTTSDGQRTPLLYMGESARKIFLLEQPDERRVRLVLDVAKDPRSLDKWLRLLRCPVPSCPSNYNMMRLVRRSLSCVQADRSDERYTELWVMLAKLNETAEDTRKAFQLMRKQGIGLRHSMLYEEEAAFEFQEGNLEAVEEILERAVDNDAMTEKQKQQAKQRVLAGEAGRVNAFGEELEGEYPRKKQVVEDVRKRKTLGEIQVDNKWKVEDRKTLELKFKSFDSSSMKENAEEKERKAVTTPRGQLSHPFTSPHPADTTPLGQTRLLTPSESGFCTLRKGLRKEAKSPVLTTPSLPTRAITKSQSTSRKPARFRFGGPALRVLPDAVNDSDDDEDDMMADAPKQPNKPLTPVKETPPAAVTAKAEAKPKKKVDIDISNIISWKPKFRGGNSRDTSPSEAGLATRMSPGSSRGLQQPSRPASVNDRSAPIPDSNPSLVVQRVQESRPVAITAAPARSLASSGASRASASEYYRSPGQQQSGAALAKSRTNMSPYSPSSSSSASSPPLSSTVNSTAQDAFASLASRVTVGGLQYIKLEQIGSGGSSKVYRMLGPDLKIYALKKIKLKKLDDQSISQYTNEIDLLRKLQGNPHIIRLVAAEQDLQQRQINVIMEHGEIDLSNRLRDLKGGMDENFLRVIWTQMLEAVEAIHNMRIIHGDLKPANFLFVNGALKLIDFGIAKAISNDTTNIERDSQIGTVNFMSPEAIQGNTMPNGQRDPEGKMKVGRASDIWSLGCILYQIVYSKPPFADVHNIIEKFRCIIDPSIPIPFQPLKNKDLENVIRSCLQRDHRRRPTIAGKSGLLNHPFLRAGGAIGAVTSTPTVTMNNAPQVLTQLGDLLRSRGMPSSRVNMFLSIGQEGLQSSNGEAPRSYLGLYNTQERRTEM